MTKFFIAIALLFFSFISVSQVNKHRLFIGTYTNSCDSDGIYVYDFDTISGDAKYISSTKKIINPSFLSISEDKTKMYSVNEVGANSQISAFNYSPDQGTLELINQVDAHGADPCYIINDKQLVIVATYSGGTISLFDKNLDGSLSFQQEYKFKGKSINKERQEKAHMHMIQFSPDKNFLLASDLGSDFVYISKYNPTQRNKTLLDIGFAKKIKPGSGPRHFTFSPDGYFVYLLNELSGTVNVFKYANGNLAFLQVTTLLEKGFKGKIGAADIHITSDGKFLYASNRGDANTISCFKIKQNGKLKFLQNISCLGKGPRNFTIDPSGKFLLVANQYSNEVVVFKINKDTGELTDTSKRIELCSPVCLVFE